jgi:hypothetical protein
VKETDMDHAACDEPARALDRTMSRVIAELREGLRHGFFEITVTCEIVSREQRRLTIRAGKSYQFLLPKDACVASTEEPIDSSNGSDIHAR